MRGKGDTRQVKKRREGGGCLQYRAELSQQERLFPQSPRKREEKGKIAHWSHLIQIYIRAAAAAAAAVVTTLVWGSRRLLLLLSCAAVKAEEGGGSRFRS